MSETDGLSELALRRVRHISNGLGAAVAATAVVVLAGWVLDVEELQRLSPGLASMKFNTAVCLGLLALAAAVRLRTPVLACCTTVLAIAGTTLLEHALGRSLGIDELLVEDRATVSSSPGRMAVLTGACLVALAVARLCLAFRFAAQAEWLAFAVGTAGSVAVLGYVYDVSSLYRVGAYSTVALHTAICLIALAAMVLLKVPSGRAPWVLFGTDPGAVVLRRMLPVAVLGVPALGYLQVLALEQDWYDAAFGIGVLVAFLGLILIAVSFRAARRLNRIDAQRRAAVRAVHLERERMARDVHDTVIQEVFAVGMHLSGLLQTAAEPRTGEVVRRALDDLDAVVEKTRRVIYQLPADGAPAQPPQATPAGLVLADRERIARDLHDHVIQQLFAVGLTLNALGLRADAAGAAELATVAETVDQTIADIRTAIHGLDRNPNDHGVRARVLGLLEELRGLPSPLPRVRIEGPVDTMISDEVGADLLAVIREALTNVARHAGATEVTFSLHVGRDGIQLEIADDGVGAGTGERRSGLANLRARAERHGGTLTVSAAREPSTTGRPGTRLCWSVPPG